MDLIKRYRWLITGLGLAVLVVAFLLFRPDKLFVDDVVDESLEDAFGAVAVETAPTTTTAPPATTPTTPPVTGSEPDAPAPTTTTVAPTTTAAPTGPVAISTGSFFGIDHRAEGTATVYEQNGDFVLRFEDDTDIQNGPDLFVWVLETDEYDGGDPGGEFIDLGKIKGNVGGQNYVLPDEFDPEVHQYVLIWCRRFSTPFAAAPLA